LYDIEVKNPVQGVKFYPEDNSRCEFLSQEEIARLLDACRSRSKAFHDIIFALLNTGCRCGELLSLTWDNVDLKNRSILIRSGIAKGKRTRHVTSAVRYSR